MTNDPSKDMSKTASQAVKTANGGQILVAALRAQGVDRVFCVPGESYLPVLDALHDVPEIEVVSARHEGAAANMAEADGKVTGRPGICMVTRGPGATHASIGIHTAFQDSTPMIMFVGQVARDARDREGFQEISYPAMFGTVAKWTADIDDTARIPEYISRAFHVALSGRPGPVVLSLPEDMLSEVVAAPPVPARAEASGSAPRAADIAALSVLLSSAVRPLVVVGGTGWTDEACKSLLAFAERNSLPVAASFRRQDLIDNRHANYCGHLGLGAEASLNERLKTADLILCIGSRLGENTTQGYSLLDSPTTAQKLVHVHPDPNEVGRVFHPTLGISCNLADFALALQGVQIPADAQRAASLKAAREAYVKFSTPPQPVASDKYVDMSAVMNWLNDNLQDDALIANGAGNYTVWVHRFYRYRKPRTELAPTSGAMGYGVPAAIAGALRCPDRQVIAFAGDGCFLMYPQEVGTAVQYGANNLIVIVVNNGIYGTIRMHQERRYPGRVVGTNIQDPDFVMMAQSFGAHAERVSRSEDFPAAFKRASAAGRPAVIELMVDPQQLTPNFRIPS